MHHTSRGLTKSQHRASQPAARSIWPAWLNHVVVSFSDKEVRFCPSLKTSCTPSENVNETPVLAKECNR